LKLSALEVDAIFNDTYELGERATARERDEFKVKLMRLGMCATVSIIPVG